MAARSPKGRRQPVMRKEPEGRIPNEYGGTLLSFCPCGAPAPHEEGAKRIPNE